MHEMIQVTKRLVGKGAELVSMTVKENPEEILRLGSL